MSHDEKAAAPVTLREIERLVATGATPASVGVLINGLELEPGQKAALWLHYWGESHRRRVARASDPQPVPGLFWG